MRGMPFPSATREVEQRECLPRSTHILMGALCALCSPTLSHEASSPIWMCAALPGVEEGGGVEPLPVQIPWFSRPVAHHRAAPSVGPFSVMPRTGATGRSRTYYAVRPRGYSPLPSAGIVGKNSTGQGRNRTSAIKPPQGMAHRVALQDRDSNPDDLVNSQGCCHYIILEWSFGWGLNPGPPPYHGGALPLSYQSRRLGRRNRTLVAVIQSHGWIPATIPNRATGEGIEPSSPRFRV